MPLPKQPYVASPDQVRITRKGDYAIIEYADSTISTTHLKMGADRLAAMTDAEVLDFWNEHVQVLFRPHARGEPEGIPGCQPRDPPDGRRAWTAP